MREFNYHRPDSPEGALALLNELENQGASLLAGGTDLLVTMKHQPLSPRHLIDIKRIPGLREIRKEGDECVVGTAVTLSEVSEHPAISRNYPVLAHAVRTIGSPQIRNQGTLGGNVCLDTKCLFLNRSLPARRSRPECLKEGGSICNIVRGAKRCYSVFAADSVPALMVMGAKVRAFGPSGSKVIAMEEIYSKNGVKPTLLDKTILTDVVLPPPIPFAIYLKERWRRSVDFPIVGLAMAIRPDGAGKRCEEVRIALTGLTGFPVRAEEAESLFKGGDISVLEDRERILEGGKKILDAARPVSPMGGLVSYRRMQTEVLLEKAIRSLSSQMIQTRDKRRCKRSNLV